MIQGEIEIFSNKKNQNKYDDINCVILDVSCTITDARMIFAHKIDICSRFAEVYRWGVSFPELIKGFKYEKKGIDEVLNKRGVPERNKKLFWTIWLNIPEYRHGSVPLFYSTIPLIKELYKAELDVMFACRLDKCMLDIVYDELLLNGLDTNNIEIRHEIPSEQLRRQDECMRTVLSNAISKTNKRRLFVDDSPGRIKEFKQIDRDSICVGITKGFFGNHDFKDVGADEVIHDISDLLYLLNQ